MYGLARFNGSANGDMIPPQKDEKINSDWVFIMHRDCQRNLPGLWGKLDTEPWYLGMTVWRLWKKPLAPAKVADHAFELQQKIGIPPCHSHQGLRTFTTKIQRFSQDGLKMALDTQLHCSALLWAYLGELLRDHGWKQDKTMILFILFFITYTALKW